MSVNNIKFIWLVVLISYICFANARQIRYSRYNTEVIEQASEDNSNVAANADNQAENNENEIQATVREIKLAPYPASGFRPSKAFPLPNESVVIENEASDNESVTDDIQTPSPETLGLTTTTTQVYESETSNKTLTEEEKEEQNNNEVDDSVNIEAGEDVLSQNENPKAPYPAAGFQPKIPFLLPTDNLYKNQPEQIEKEEYSTELSLTEIPEENSTDLPTDTKFKPKIPLIAAGRNLLNTIFKNQEKSQDEEENENLTELPVTEVNEENTTELPLESEAKAPYPAAGYRPSKAFLLPAAQLKLAEMETDTKHDTIPKEDNSKHPICGSSTNPLAPKPLKGEKEDPNSESIYINTQTQQKSQQQTLLVPVPVRLTAQPVIVARPLVYTGLIQAW